jgi:hypothetical protein
MLALFRSTRINQTEPQWFAIRTDEILSAQPHRTGTWLNIRTALDGVTSQDGISPYVTVVEPLDKVLAIIDGCESRD